jgi:flagellar operon protein
MVRQVNGIGAQVSGINGGNVRSAGAPSFGKVLGDAIRQSGGVKLSGHAAERLRERNITLGEADMRRIDAATDKVASKGGRDALIVMDKVGLIVDVPNRTVVTAIGKQQMQENVFTNIDSAIFA